MISRFFVDIACDLPERCARASFLEFANAAVAGLCQVIPDPTIMDCPRGSQRPTVRTDIDVALGFVSEVEAREHAIGSFVSFPHGNMRRDVLVQEPGKQLAGAISSIGCEPLRL